MRLAGYADVLGWTQPSRVDGRCTRGGQAEATVSADPARFVSPTPAELVGALAER